MTCPKCHCAQCRRERVNERLRHFLLSRETPIDLPDEHAEELARKVADLNTELAALP
jgi:hypothetical protein